MDSISLVVSLCVAIVAFGLGYLLREMLARTRFKGLQEESERILAEARTKHREIDRRP